MAPGLALAALLWLFPDVAAARAAGNARYAALDPAGALDAWNTIAEPHIGAVRLHDVTRTHAAVVTRLLALAPGDLLTRARWERAERRLRELPAAAATMTFGPDGHGLVDVDVTLDEATLVPSGIFGLGAVGGKAIILHDLEVPISNLLHRGDVWTTAFRWPAAWRRVLFDVALPSPAPFAGEADARTSWERQTYARPGGAPTVIEDHSQIAFSCSDWIGGRAQWQGGVTADRWNSRRHVGVTGSLDIRFIADRLSVGSEGAVWSANGRESGFSRSDLWVAWRSTARPRTAIWMVRAESGTTSPNAPLDLWTGAGAGQGRAPLLRAHSLLTGDVIGGPVFGRTLAHATGEYQRHLRDVATTTLRVAAFVDVARARHRMDGSSSPWLADAGVGVRWAAPGLGSVIRLDLAHGLGHRDLMLSAGWQAPWPR